jgi:hypothetical protein
MNWIEVNGTSYEVSGNGPTTLVHEMGDTLDSWDHVLPSIIEPMSRTIPGAQFLELNSGHFASGETLGLVT